MRENIKKMQEDITEYLINSLRVLNEEYDALVKEEEEIQHRNICETGRGDERYLVHDILERSINVVNKTEEKWEEKKEDCKMVDIMKLSKGLKKEKASCARKRAVLERKLNLEKSRVDSLNKIISSSIPLAEGREIIEEELNTVIFELEKLSVKETIYPSAILQIRSVYDELESKIKEMESFLSKYADLPPDYAKAKEKLAEAQMIENTLDQRIRKAIKRN